MASWPLLIHENFLLKIAGKHTNVYCNIDNAHGYYRYRDNTYCHNINRFIVIITQPY